MAAPHQENAGSEKAELLDLTQSLSDIRDVWVECSLMLKDAYFDLEADQREALAEYLENMMENMMEKVVER